MSDRRQMRAMLPGALAIIGAVLAIATAAIAWPHPRLWLGAWLAAQTIWLGLPLAGLGLALTHALTGGRWEHALGGEIDAAIVAMPLALVLFLPLLFDLGVLYPWATPTGADLANHAYLNGPFFTLRGLVIFAVWLVLAATALRLRARGDAEPLSRAAGPGLILLFLSGSLIAIDWTMSLEPDWNSTIYGLLVLADQFVFGLAFLIAARLLAAPAPECLPDLAKLLLGAVIFWAYLAFMQFLIVWESDLSKELPWYQLRARGAWGAVAGLIVFGYFLIPFAALILRRVQRSGPAMLAVALLLLVMHAAYDWWLVLPAVGGFGWPAPVVLLGFTLLWIGAFTWLRDRAEPIGRMARGRQFPRRRHAE
jgi:hypothetical protein